MDSTPDATIIEALALLTPYDVDQRKARIGPPRDGGYVLLPDLLHRQSVLSYGISTEYRFDMDLAARGHEILMFDHTIARLENPEGLPRLNWVRQGIAGQSDPANNLDTLENHVARYVPGEGDLILKMDVEGFEYDVFDTAPVDLLRRFQQIVFEIHDLHSLPDAAFRARFARVLRKLNAIFTLFHVHGNNFDGQNTYTFLSGVPVANLLELSYVRSDLVTRSASSTLYPTAIDYPNVHPDDKRLWFFPFLPTSLDAGMFAAADRRLEAVADEKRRGG